MALRESAHPGKPAHAKCKEKDALACEVQRGQGSEECWEVNSTKKLEELQGPLGPGGYHTDQSLFGTH